MHVKFHLAEVISNNNIDTYKRTETDNAIVDFFLITVRTYDAARTQDIDCRPANPNIKQIPLIGEHVLIFQGTNEFSNIDKFRRQWYYLPAYSIQSAINENALPGVARLRASDINPLPSQDDTPLGKSFKQTIISSLQPYEGDTIIEGRFSNSIRLSSTVTGGDYTLMPSWNGNTNGDPIIILSNKRNNKPGKQFVVEDIKQDGASLYLTSTQTFPDLQLYKPLTKSTSESQYNSSQIIGSADRIILQAKKDIIALDANKRVTINTPNLYIGDETACEAMVHGDVLLSILIDILNVLSAGGVGTSGILTQPKDLESLQSAREQLQNLNSSKFFIKRDN